jgi:hypothetical protein
MVLCAPCHRGRLEHASPDDHTGQDDRDRPEDSEVVVAEVEVARGDREQDGIGRDASAGRRALAPGATRMFGVSYGCPVMQSAGAEDPELDRRLSRAA